VAILDVPLFPSAVGETPVETGPAGSPKSFHPAVQAWFDRAFPDGATPPQLEGWPHIAAGRDTLIAAPTGSGKTLAGFLVCIDQLYRAHDAAEAAGGALADLTHVVYVSPLRALALDIAQNLERPLTEIAEVAAELGLSAPELRIGLRSGDTSQSARAKMLRKPPHFVITTPESLYLLATGAKGRDLLRSTRTVIIDEIHTMARDKRGSHLALTMERVANLCEVRPVRVGLSATQKPIETVAELLVGSGPTRRRADGSVRCEIVDTGHQRTIDLELLLPGSELEAVSSTEQTGEVLDQIAELVNTHTTTIVFVNTRRLAERIAHQLAERLGDEAVAAHHGSLSKDTRLRVEDRLRRGDLKALVATASLELGIDVGPVDLVCQLGSPRSIATFLQRVGRSGHSRYGTPKGRIFPLTRDELVECSALLAAIRAGRLDALHPPRQPLDILAQQLVAEVAADDWRVDDLYDLVRGAAPYRDLPREDFDEALALVSDGVDTGRGTRAAYVHHDRINGEVTARRGARLAAVTSGGAIPELADYRVVSDPDDTFIGTVGEDWAIESMVGDIFLLGSNSWRIRRVEASTVRVTDAGGLPPTVPFWVGEAPARTAELSAEVSALRAGVAKALAAGGAERARSWVAEVCGLAAEPTELLVAYLADCYTALGNVLPTQHQLVIERFFDESGGMQLVVHAPFGGRINRAFGLALRKKFCASFDFELQAAANDDAVVLSLGPQHSFPLEEVARYLHPNTVDQTLVQAMLRPISPLFASRWRWNLNRSLVVLRFKGGRKNPPPIQRMESDDVMGVVFPSIAACQENVQGPLEIPDHLLARQTIADTLTEAMDAEGLKTLVSSIVSGEVNIVCRDTTEASPLSHELLNGKPYTFLDDAPLEERRTRAVQTRRGISVAPTDIAALDQAAIDRVCAEAAPRVETADELHDLLNELVVMPLDHTDQRWQPLFDSLVERHRAFRFTPTTAGLHSELWCVTERAGAAAALFGDDVLVSAAPEVRHFAAAHPADGSIDDQRRDASRDAVRGLLNITGPATVQELSRRSSIDPGLVETALVALEVEGFAFQGSFSPVASPGTDPGGAARVEWCARRLLNRIHRYTQKRLRAQVQPVSAQTYMHFLLAWQHVHPDHQLRGPKGVVQVIEQLQGWDLAAGAWEKEILARRVADYRPQMLDELCLSGEVVWARLATHTGTPATPADTGQPAESPATTRATSPSKSTPISLMLRNDLGWLLTAVRPTPPATANLAGADTSDLHPDTAAVLHTLSRAGARFPAELASDCGLTPQRLEAALWDGVSQGLVTADGFGAVRALFAGRTKSVTPGRRRRRLRQGATPQLRQGGRWALVPPGETIEERDLLAEAVAEQLLARWGVIVRDIAMRERLAIPWREVQWALRRLEDRGVVRGGRFVSGFGGEQYALPEAVSQLRQSRSDAPAHLPSTPITVNATDPLNLTGVLFPGTRVPARRTNTVTID
jgi:ATP-dependent Lhr-like helicase